CRELGASRCARHAWRTPRARGRGRQVAVPGDAQGRVSTREAAPAMTRMPPRRAVVVGRGTPRDGRTGKAQMRLPRCTPKYLFRTGVRIIERTFAMSRAGILES